MRVETETQKKANNEPVERDRADASQSKGLQNDLRAMSYDEGVKALSPNGSMTGAPDQQKGASEVKATPATKTAAEAKPDTAKAQPSKDTKGTAAASGTNGGAPLGAGQIWYTMAVGSTGLPPAYEQAVPVGMRCIVPSFQPEGGGPPVKVFTTHEDWIAVKVAIQNQRYMVAKNEADLANQQAANGQGGVQGHKRVVRVGKPCVNKFATYFIVEEGVQENDPYKLGHDVETWWSAKELHRLGWPFEEVQKLYNIKPGFKWPSAVGPVAKKAPVYKSDIASGAPVPTKYALKHRAQIYPPAWVESWTDKTQPVD